MAQHWLTNARSEPRMLGMAVSLIILATLSAVFLARLESPVAQAERTHVAMRVAELQSAVLLMQATMVAADDWSAAAGYVGSNPMLWLELDEGQSHYLGEAKLDSIDASEAAGKWVFDPERRVIAYRPMSDDWWPANAVPDLPWLQFQVVGLWSEDAPERIIGLQLAALANAPHRDLLLAEPDGMGNE